MAIPRRRIAALTLFALATLSSNPPAIAEAPAPAPAKVVATPSPAAVHSSYVAQPGDTPWKIAQRFQIDWDQLAEMNPSIRQKNGLHGMKLTIPDKPSINSVSQPVMAVQKQVGYTRAGELLQYAKVLSCTVTAYTAGPESTGKSPGDPAYGITASGTKVAEGRTIAVDPKVISIGSRVYIEGIGFRIAEDTGGAVKGEHIDVFLNDMTTAVNFGIQREVRVYVLK